MGFSSMIRHFHCTEFQATIGLSVYPLGFGLIPLVSASFSEEFGRLPLYIGSGLGFLLMFPMIALYGSNCVFLRVKSIHLHLHSIYFDPGLKISKQSSWHDFYKVRLDLRGQLWLEGRSLIYGHLRSMFFDNNFTHLVGAFFQQAWTTDVYFCFDGRRRDRVWTCLCWLD